MGDHYLKKELYNLINNDASIFKFIQSGILDGIWYWDLEKPESEWMSPKFWETLGYNPDEKKHLASEWQDMIFQEDLKLAVKNLEKHCADPNHPYDQIVRYRHKNGSTVWIRCRGLAIRDENGKAIRMLGAHTYITDIKKKEEKIKESIELIEDLSNQAPGALYQFQLFQDGSSRFPYASEGIYQIYEVTPEEMIKDAGKAFERFHPDDYDQVVNSIQKSADTLDLWHDEYRVILPNQGEKWVEGKAKPEKMEDGSVLWHGNIREITEEKKMQLKIKNQKDRFGFIIEGTDAGTWEWNVQTGETKFNEKWAEMLGYKLEELEPTTIETWEKHTHPEDLKKAKKNLEKHFRGETEQYDVEIRMKHKDGHWVWMNDRGKVISWTKDNRPYKMFGIHLDITEQKRKEEKIKNLNKRLKNDINKAKKLHENTLPNTIPEINKLDVHAYYKPANEVGGDYYNFIKLNDDKLLFYLSDVTGHGLEAAEMSAFIKSTINSYLALHPSARMIEPKEIIEFIFKQNQKENFPEDYFIAILIGIIDTAENKMIYSSAGMQVPLIIFNNNLTELTVGNLPISKVLPLTENQYQNREVKLPRGTTLFVATDGIYEQMNINNEEYGDRYKDVICQTCSLPAEAIAKEINRDFSAFYDKQTDDDITYAIFKVK